jgi:phage host-nuclease inhibitor protein Gam
MAQKKQKQPSNEERYVAALFIVASELDVSIEEAQDFCDELLETLTDKGKTIDISLEYPNILKTKH